MELQGCYTALVTPFRNGKVDLEALGRLIEEQITAGIDGLVPVGTTGESPTLDFEEHQDVVRFTVETVAGRCQVIAGTGANCTAEAVRLTRHAASVGADATLQVTPYYNKPTAEGLYRHFAAVADEGGLPVVLYNVPSRTGKEIDIQTVHRLAQHPLIVAIKEAGGSADRVSQILSGCGITVLCGDDSLTLPMMSLGATGVISVASNVVPADVTNMVHAALEDNWEEARDLHYRLYPLFRDLFVETNPVPVKAALAMLGKIAEEYRLPLCPISPAAREVLKAAMKAAGLAV
ncbi:MAG: 4-hydroxy-tetrahydrodipicolinate synthase [Lentisphaerae bacterium RIFOXYB12_FULL_65_16]|nr:MAG: 4-hydroxy-tetrahydrodipicolinate synthase [Lentisphaerae bacterium RIFOXYA12_64_32]OGV92503.1 MAG: 4-hydroxy-tetrahydrodipicolinate synthase [Lentisphaerae bacterium RIFOXYB12_FULL_65_16]